MSEKLPNMLETTIQKIREMVDANTVVGKPVTTPDGVTILPVSKISVGLGGGGSDFAMSKAPAGQMPFGGGVGAGVKVTPVAFLVVKDGNVRTIQLADPNNSLERAITMLPELVDKLAALLKKEKPEAQAPAEDGPDAP